jgi:hypothetical protein
MMNVRLKAFLDPKMANAQCGETHGEVILCDRRVLWMFMKVVLQEGIGRIKYRKLCRR